MNLTSHQSLTGLICLLQYKTLRFGTYILFLTFLLNFCFADCMTWSCQTLKYTVIQKIKLTYTQIFRCVQSNRWQGHKLRGKCLASLLVGTTLKLQSTFLGTNLCTAILLLNATRLCVHPEVWELLGEGSRCQRWKWNSINIHDKSIFMTTPGKTPIGVIMPIKDWWCFLAWCKC